MTPSYLLALVPALLLSGCADWSAQRAPVSSQVTWEDAAANQFIPTNQRAANTLIDQARARGLEIDPALMMATLVNINALEESSPFGRMVAEQISGQFSRRGHQIVEMKFRENIYVKQNVGELVLTREIQQLAKTHRAQAVIVGTYAESDQVVLVNLKVIRATDNIVLASHDYAMPMNKMVRSLLPRR